MPLDKSGISLANLQPGTYKVMIQRDITDLQDVTDKETECFLSITIIPPFYRSIWAYIVYFLLFALLATMIVGYIKQKRETKRKIEELYRKLKLHNDPNEEKTTMAPADKQLLEQGARRISDVAYECGFNDPKKFSKYFKEEFGVSPGDYLK